MSVWTCCCSLVASLLVALRWTVTLWCWNGWRNMVKHLLMFTQKQPGVFFLPYFNSGFQTDISWSLVISLQRHFSIPYWIVRPCQRLSIISRSSWENKGEVKQMKNIHLQATLKKYQSERKSKVESIERCQSQLKKLRRKSQGSRHPNKYGDREMQVHARHCGNPKWFCHNLKSAVCHCNVLS